MPIYTRNGDTGTTSLYGNVRVDKDDRRIEVCGNIDELSASLGIVRAEGEAAQFESLFLRIQQELILFCAEIVSDTATILPKHIEQIETEIDNIERELPPLTQFVIPGSNRISAMLHLSRTICRRAERSLATLHRTKNTTPHHIAYLNRLSDLLFLMACKTACE
jgi:cob(I)alamin adenosyltransferase